MSLLQKQMNSIKYEQINERKLISDNFLLNLQNHIPNVLNHKKSCEIYEKQKILISHLSHDTSERILRRYFSRFGNIQECCIIKNRENGQSCGYGFIKFINSFSVNSVFETKPHYLNGKIINVKRVFDQIWKTCYSYSVFISNLPIDITEIQLLKYFKIFGKVMDISLVYNQIDKKIRCIGYVRFYHQSAKNRCLAQRYIQMKSTIISIKDSNEIFYNNNQSQMIDSNYQDRNASNLVNQSNDECDESNFLSFIVNPEEFESNIIEVTKVNTLPKIFLANLPKDVTETNIIMFFRSFGEINNIFVTTNEKNMNLQRYGILSFEKQESLDRCLAEYFFYMNSSIKSHQLNSNILIYKDSDFIKPFGINSSIYPRVFLRGLPCSITKRVLEMYFENFGKIIDIIIHTEIEKNDVSKCGILSFESQDAANRCIAEQFVYFLLFGVNDFILGLKPQNEHSGKIEIEKFENITFHIPDNSYDTILTAPKISGSAISWNTINKSVLSWYSNRPISNLNEFHSIKKNKNSAITITEDSIDDSEINYPEKFTNCIKSELVIRTSSNPETEKTDVKRSIEIVTEEVSDLKQMKIISRLENRTDVQKAIEKVENKLRKKISKLKSNIKNQSRITCHKETKKQMIQQRDKERKEKILENHSDIKLFFTKKSGCRNNNLLEENHFRKEQNKLKDSERKSVKDSLPKSTGIKDHQNLSEQINDLSEIDLFFMQKDIKNEKSKKYEEHKLENKGKKKIVKNKKIEGEKKNKEIEGMKENKEIIDKIKIRKLPKQIETEKDHIGDMKMLSLKVMKLNRNPLPGEDKENINLKKSIDKKEKNKIVIKGIGNLYKSIEENHEISLLNDHDHENIEFERDHNITKPLDRKLSNEVTEIHSVEMSKLKKFKKIVLKNFNITRGYQKDFDTNLRELATEIDYKKLIEETNFTEFNKFVEAMEIFGNEYFIESKVTLLSTILEKIWDDL